MKPSSRVLLVGIAFLLASLALAAAGSSLDSLPVLVLSLIVGVAGAFVALRGVLDFLTDRF